MTVNKLKLKSELKLDLDRLIVEPGKQIKLDDYDPGMTEPYLDKKMAADRLKKDVQQLAKLQNILYAEDSYSVLIILKSTFHQMERLFLNFFCMFQKKNKNAGCYRELMRKKKIGS